MSLFSAPARPTVVAVLRADPDLAGGLEGVRRRQGEQLSVARTIRRAPGPWDARHDADLASNGAGLLIFAGMLVREVGVGRRHAAELLAAGDILQPWEHDDESATGPFDATWRVVADLRLAVLDRAWLARMSPFPEVTAALVSRALARSRRLATMHAIGQERSLDRRLLLLLTELADRHGRVVPDGVQLTLGLTHETLGYLCGAQRPSVSASLGRLQREGRLRRTGDQWLLPGQHAAAAS